MYRNAELSLIVDNIHNIPELLSVAALAIKNLRVGQVQIWVDHRMQQSLFYFIGSLVLKHRS